MKDRRNLQRALYVFYTVPRGYIKCIKLHFSFIVEDYVRLPRATDHFLCGARKKPKEKKIKARGKLKVTSIFIYVLHILSMYLLLYSYKHFHTILCPIPSCLET